MIRRKLINYAESSCDFRIGFGVLDELNKIVDTVVGTPKRAVIVTETDLAATEGILVSRGLTDAGFRVSDLALPSGERVATLAYAQQLFDALDGTGVTADDVIVALGGAETCGITQFCAKCWCGGTACVLIPTTLDAMATVATAMEPLDTESSSSMVWLPARPALVACDLGLVAKAEPEALRAGYLELMAATLMDCRRAWERFGEQIDGILAAEEIPLVDALCEAQSARLSVIKAPNPSSRSAVRYGVTTARGLRACLGAKVPWYRLLAEGMRFEARLATEASDFNVEDVFLQDDYLDFMGIDELPFSLTVPRFLAALRETRFKRANRFMFSLPHSVGSIRYAVVEDELLERHAEAYLASRADLLDADA